VSTIAAWEGAPAALIVVVGSQAILASYQDTALPEAMTRSVEADVIVLTSNRADVDRLATLVDGAIGEASLFHQSYGYYGQGVGPESSILPDGWADRLVPIHDPVSATTAYCLEPHDLCAAKLCAGRPKDLDYVQAALDTASSTAPRCPSGWRRSISRRRVVPKGCSPAWIVTR
jgi:hypothetical protein